MGLPSPLQPQEQINLSLEDNAQRIGERRYYLKGKSPNEAEVVVSLSLPSKSDSGYYNCRYQITWEGQTNSGEISGIDEIDAVISGLAVIGSWVYGLNESTYAHRLAWDGSDGNDLGLPTIEHHWPFHGELKQRL